MQNKSRSWCRRQPVCIMQIAIQNEWLGLGSFLKSQLLNQHPASCLFQPAAYPEMSLSYMYHLNNIRKIPKRHSSLQFDQYDTSPESNETKHIKIQIDFSALSFSDDANLHQVYPYLVFKTS